MKASYTNIKKIKSIFSNDHEKQNTQRHEANIKMEPNYCIKETRYDKEEYETEGMGVRAETYFAHGKYKRAARNQGQSYQYYYYQNVGQLFLKQKASQFN